jgi:DNA repair exonuclease SbcCD ATPase subunit
VSDKAAEQLKSIVDNAPSECTHYDKFQNQYWDWPNRTMKPFDGGELDLDYPDYLSSLADIQAIVDLRRENAELEAKYLKVRTLASEQHEEMVEGDNASIESDKERIAELEKELETTENNLAYGSKLLNEAGNNIAELERKRDELKEENLSLQAYVFRAIAFVTRAVEKLKAIPEFKPTGYVLNRVLRMTPKTALEAHNLEQQIKGANDFAGAHGLQSVVDLAKTNEAVLRNQIKALKESK